jgi:hypothetical protein
VQPEACNDGGGTVCVGLAHMSNLEEARAVTSGRSGSGAAEGGAFDPAVIKLLAVSYSLGRVVPDGADPTACVADAVEAFQSNEVIARNAGLVGHSVIMSSIAALVPLLHRSAVQPAATDADPALAAIERDPFRQLALQSLSEVLLELLDGGDCQHFVVCHEILRRARLLGGLCEPPRPKPAAADAPSGGKGAVETKRAGKEPEGPGHRRLQDARVREAYLSYIDILTRLGQFTEANDLVVTSNDPYISELSKKGVRFKVGCSSCGKEIAADQVVGPGAKLTALTSLWCSKCARCAGRCAVCQKPVLDLFRWCPICSHGGHRECIESWFKRSSSMLCQEVPSAGRRSAGRRDTRLRSRAARSENRPEGRAGRRPPETRSVSPSRYLEGSFESMCPAGCGHQCAGFDLKCASTASTTNLCK